MLKTAFLVCVLSLGVFVSGAFPRTMTLPPPDKTGGMPLMQALAERRSERSFSDRTLSARTLSDLLWAAWGVNRPDGRRTAPTGRNSRRVEVYAVLESGVWRYDADKHLLLAVLPGDHRNRLGKIPAALLFAAPQDDDWAGMHVGSVYQNAGLYCASAKLACVVKISGVNAFSPDELRLPANYRVYITQIVGFPK
jgi:hypothetical protein